MKPSALLLSLLLAAGGPASAASVLNSKHDLSYDSATTGPKAVSEKDSCVFCHSAHKPAILRPLWNRSDSAQTFTFYSSNYLNTYLGMAAPTMADLAGSKTKLCLSCHDGVTALGAVYNLAPNTIAMTGSMGPSAILGTDLRNDHPVLYDVKPGAGPPTQPGTNPEIQLPPGGDAVKVYGATNRVECTSCHNPHDNQYGYFLAKSNANAALCTTCHVKTNFSTSIHATSIVAYTPSGGSATTVKEWSCRNCHKTHGASSAQAYLLAGAEENTCYLCHGSPPLTGARNIKALFAKTYKHKTETVSGVHKNPETDASNLGLSTRHAECWDCHNPHQTRTGTHTAGTTTGNVVSNVLLGAWGVLPTWAATIWTSATTYTRQVFTDTTNYKEFQLCFKCHSYYAYGATPPAGYTDPTIEFNPLNKSAHPVRDSANNQTGSSAPKALVAAQMSAPWATSLGTQKMSCSDCHDSDVTTDPKGPHGSAAASILKGPRKFWPKNAAGGLWTLNMVRSNLNSWSTDLFCVNCHPLYSGSSFKNNVHSEGNHQGSTVTCMACHSQRVHGVRRSRLIVYNSELSPYDYSGSTATLQGAVIMGFKKATTPTGYSKSNCYNLSTVSACSTHSNAGGYDP